MKAETKNLGCIREAWRIQKPSVIQPTPSTDTGTYLTGRTKLFRKIRTPTIWEIQNCVRFTCLGRARYRKNVGTQSQQARAQLPLLNV